MMTEKLEDIYSKHWEQVEITLDRNKSDNGSLGFRIAGGTDGLFAKYKFTNIFVINIYKDGLADKDKQLKLSDTILRVNNEDIQNVLCQTALEILRTSGPIVRLTVKRINPKLCESIELKHKGKLGVSIAGGVCNTYVLNDPGVFITQLSMSFPNEQLSMGDRLVDISSEKNTYDLRWTTFETAKKYIRTACSESENIRLTVVRVKPFERLTIEVIDLNEITNALSHKMKVLQEELQAIDVKINSTKEPVEENECTEEINDENEEPLIVPFDDDDYKRYEKRCKRYSDDWASHTYENYPVDVLPKEDQQSNTMNDKLSTSEENPVKVIYRIVTIESIDVHQSTNDETVIQQTREQQAHPHQE